MPENAQHEGSTPEATSVSRRYSALTALFERRDDLRGTYAPADFFVEAVSSNT